MHRYLLPGLKLSPDVIQRIVDRIPDDRLDVPTHPDRFTPREVICHLADWEPILRNERIKGALERPGEAFLAYDEVEMAAANNYADRDVNEQLRTFAMERAETVALVRQIQPEAWENVAHHPELGDMKLSDIVNMLVGHDMYHIEQLTAVLP
jgi:hypothetical protein